MTDELEIEDVKYISSKRASELSGYAQDYIGQLARKGHISARRVGGLWYISMDSLKGYEAQADTYKPQPPERKQANDPDSLITFDGKDYISAGRASKITGYHQDYVGQLARGASIPSRQVGNRWYIEREAVLAHKNEKDKLLGAVQAQSVGIQHRALGEPEKAKKPYSPDTEDYFTYTRDDGELFPPLLQREEIIPKSGEEYLQDTAEREDHVIPIHIVRKEEILDHGHHVKYVKSEVRKPKKTMFYGTLAATALTIVILLTFGFSSLKDSSLYTVNIPAFGGLSRGALTASAEEAFRRIGDILEKWIVPELVYRRGK